jgi:hypothetical protein
MVLGICPPTLNVHEDDEERGGELADPEGRLIEHRAKAHVALFRTAQAAPAAVRRHRDNRPSAPPLRTRAKLSELSSQLSKLAGMARNGLAVMRDVSVQRR